MNAETNPYARPLERRWYATFAAIALVVVLLIGGVLGAERYLRDDRATEALLAAFIAHYQELFLAALPGEGAAEYVVFVVDGTEPADLQRFFDAQQVVRFDREGVLPGTMVVTLDGDPRAGLALLREQAFVNLAVRNQGAFFCH